MSERFDYRETEKFAEVRGGNVVDPGGANPYAWVQTTGRPKHNRVMVWVRFAPPAAGSGAATGTVTFWAGDRDPYSGRGDIAFGQLPITRGFDASAQPREVSVVAEQFNVPPGASIGVMLSALAVTNPPADFVADIWWTSWIEAE